MKDGQERDLSLLQSTDSKLDDASPNFFVLTESRGLPPWPNFDRFAGSKTWRMGGRMGRSWMGWGSRSFETAAHSTLYSAAARMRTVQWAKVGSRMARPSARHTAGGSSWRPADARRCAASRCIGSPAKSARVSCGWRSEGEPVDLDNGLGSFFPYQTAPERRGGRIPTDRDSPTPRYSRWRPSFSTVHWQFDQSPAVRSQRQSKPAVQGGNSAKQTQCDTRQEGERRQFRQKMRAILAQVSNDGEGEGDSEAIGDPTGAEECAHHLASGITDAD
jgi:hypothetical protein